MIADKMVCVSIFMGAITNLGAAAPQVFVATCLCHLHDLRFPPNCNRSKYKKTP